MLVRIVSTVDQEKRQNHSTLLRIFYQHRPSAAQYPARLSRCCTPAKPARCSAGTAPDAQRRQPADQAIGNRAGRGPVGPPRPWLGAQCRRPGLAGGGRTRAGRPGQRCAGRADGRVRAGPATAADGAAELCAALVIAAHDALARTPPRYLAGRACLHAGGGLGARRLSRPLRVGAGPWKGLVAERLTDSALIAVAAPTRAARLRYGDHTAIAAEPLLGHTELWDEFLALCGCKLSGKSVADFNDSGLMLQAAEGDLGIALARELLAADALQAGRLVRVSPLALSTLQSGGASTYWCVYPAGLADWPPLLALRLWLADEMTLAPAADPAALVSPSTKVAKPPSKPSSKTRAKTSPSGQTGSQSRAPSPPPARRPR